MPRCQRELINRISYQMTQRDWRYYRSDGWRAIGLMLPT